MGTFSDDFNRANGAPGGNWVTVAGTPAIESNWLRNTPLGVAALYNTTISDGARHECAVRLTLSAQATNHAGPLVKWNGANATGYLAAVVFSTPNWYLRIYAGAWGSLNQIASVTLSAGPPTIYTLRLVWDDGHLTASIVGGESVQVDDATYANGVYMGLAVHYNVQMADWVTMLTGAAQDFQVTPEVVGNYGATTELTFTGTETAWTPGTPGSPTFTCDHGALSGQVVASATSASATFDPLDYLGPVVLTDPSTGLTDTIIVTSDPNVLPPTQEDPWMHDDGVLAKATIDLFSPDYILTDQSPIIESTQEVPGRLAILDAIRQIWNAHFGEWTGTAPPDQGVFSQLLALIAGSYTPTVELYTSERHTSIREELELVRDSLTELRTGADWTLYDVAILLGGLPIISHQDLKTLIEEGGSNQAVLDMLESMWGPQRPTLTDLAQLVNEMATVAGYTLGDVLDAIAALQLGVNVDLTPVLNRLDLIQPDTSISLSHLHADLATTDGVVDTMAASLAQIRGPGLITFQDILDAITQLRHDISLDLSTLKLPPIWPGFAHVTLGASVDLATVTNVDGPMHGCIVQITATEPGTSFMQYDGVKAWRHVGGLVFYDDHGQCETYQALGFGEALYVPKTMAVAQGVKLFKSHLPRGSITPWTINP